jgi:hypothetical protein
MIVAAWIGQVFEDDGAGRGHDHERHPARSAVVKEWLREVTVVAFDKTGPSSEERLVATVLDGLRDERSTLPPGRRSGPAAV